MGPPGLEGLPGDSTFSGPKGEVGEPGETKYCLPDLRLPLEMYSSYLGQTLTLLTVVVCGFPQFL